MRKKIIKKNIWIMISASNYDRCKYETNITIGYRTFIKNNKHLSAACLYHLLLLYYIIIPFLWIFFLEI